MNFFIQETIDFVKTEFLKHFQKDQKPIKRDTLRQFLNFQKEDEEYMVALIKRELSNHIVVQHGPGGGYVSTSYLKKETEVSEDFVNLVKSIIEKKLDTPCKNGGKVSVQDIQFEPGEKKRKNVELALDKLPEFYLAKGRGIARHQKSKFALE